MSAADLRHIDVWLFDLDNTLYPPNSGFMALIEQKMTDFVARAIGLSRPEAYELQKRYYHEHGTTLAGLMAHHGVDPEDYLDEVHDVSTDSLIADAELVHAIARLPGRRLVFTNGHDTHATRVLDRLDLTGLFEAVFHLGSADYIPKPAPATFDKMARDLAIDPRRTAFFEDSEKNLAPAAAMGMTTVLVGPHAQASQASFVHHRTDQLAPFLNVARIKETTP